MKIVYIPLDERPCNYAFAQQIAKGSPIELAVPAMDLLGSKKTPTDTAGRHAVRRRSRCG